MANALGATDREAMHGIIRQLVKASVSGESPDEVNLSFMISMVKSIKPRDSVEAMLVAQMVFRSCDGDAMCPSPCACGQSRPARQCRGAHWGRLARTFSRPDRGAQPLSEPRRACHYGAERVGGRRRPRPLSENVTQHASVIVSDKNPAIRGAKTRRRPRAPGEGTISADAKREATDMSDHISNTGPMLASPRLWREKTRCGGRVPLAGGARQEALPHATAAHRDPARPRGKPETRASTACSPGIAIAERRQIQALLGEARKLLEEMK